MAYVITQNCCKDASCVPVCPVDCIRPATAPGVSPTTEMLYIDPDTCIDCGACVSACPVDAIKYADDLSEDQHRFAEINAAYFRAHPLTPDTNPIQVKHAPIARGALRIAIVGAGAAACYAAAELIAIDGVEVDLFERLPTPFGLIRAGVAPDHQHTKAVVSVFEAALANTRLGCLFNVEVGTHIHHGELLEHYHAVIYAVGASTGRRLGIAGEDLPGVHPAADFVGWYNGHPDHVDHRFDLSGERAVIVGNGNVALDVARMLLADPDVLRATDMAEHAVDALSGSAIREVVILGRRDVRDGAFSVGELLALGHLPGIDVIVEGDTSADDSTDVETAMKLQIAHEYAQRSMDPDNRRIVLRCGATPVGVAGAGHVAGLQIAAGGGQSAVSTIATSLVLCSIGYRGQPISGVPFDTDSATVPNQHGRVVDEEARPVPGVYVTGWIKRGPRGVIGTNRGCAEETVAAVLSDFDSGLLDRNLIDRVALRTLLRERGAQPVDWSGWRAIDTDEQARGVAAGRPRQKFVRTADMLTAAGG